ncbi:hypothetical protein MMC07_006254 [Pseudocyphellaria aurata]|nr:hypothetical protein [Pseudocyphellaria aurata]
MDINEIDIVCSLGYLQEMHDGLRHLRETIPRILDPLLGKKSSPEALYGNFSRAATGAFKDIEEFSGIIDDPRNRSILERARISRAENSEGITGWKVTEHKNWLDMPMKLSPKDSADGLDEGKNRVNVSDELDLRAAMKKLEGRFAGIEVSFMPDDSNSMEIFLPSAAPMRAKVEAKYTQNQPSYVTTLVGKPNILFTPIIEQINNRPNPCELEPLLVSPRSLHAALDANVGQAMFASYSNLLSSPCIKCNQLFDRGYKFPLARKPKGTKAGSNCQTSQWQALHIECSYTGIKDYR